MLGTVLGALTIAVIGNGLILSHISPFFTQIVTGAIILVAIWLNTQLFSGGLRLRTETARHDGTVRSPCRVRSGDDRARPDPERRSGHHADARASS